MKLLPEGGSTLHRLEAAFIRAEDADTRPAPSMRQRG
jgi:hypothetical protein